MPWAAASAWKPDDGFTQYLGLRGCANASESGNLNRGAWEQNCKGDFGWGHHKGKGRKTYYRCVSACGPNVYYQRGAKGHPCSGAQFIKGIPINIEGWKDHSGVAGKFPGAHGAFWCRFPDSDRAMVDASKRSENTQSKSGDGSIYHQLIYGSTIGGQYNSAGFCENVANLPKVVHKDGRTCFDMIKDGVSASAAEIKGRKFCETNRTDPKCRCINVADPGFLDRCRQNPNWAGCKEINAAFEDFKKAGIKTDSGLFGNADCLVPQICSGSNLYQPESRMQACATKMAICNQVMALDNIKAAAGIQAAQACNINFEAEQKKKDDAKVAAAAAAAKAAADKAAADKAAADKAAADRAAADRAAADRAAADKAVADKAVADKAAADKVAADKAAADRAAAAKLAADTAAAKAQAAGASPAQVQAAADKAAADVESKPIEDFLKPTGFGILSGFSTTQLGIGAGGAILLCCCCIILLILAMSG